MDRRRFLLGASALGVTACAHPERNLLDDFAGSEIPLEPGGRRVVTTTTAAPVDEQPIDDAEQEVELDVADDDEPGLVFVAEAIPPLIAVTASPGATEPVFEFANPIDSGGPLVFLVEQFGPADEIEVLLPTRPNGSFGWVAATDVNLTRHNYAIEVRLDDFLLIVTDRDLPIFETTVGVARDNAPTPLGRYYTTELLQPPTPDSVYGAYAYGLSGFSDTFTTFAGGDGQLGIHGTNDPDTLGSNVSSGCIRLHNDDIRHLVEAIGLPVGVPVRIV